MKTYLLAAAFIPLAGLSLGANYHFINQARNASAMLEDCAKSNNVYPTSCQLQAVVVNPRSVLLPPPSQVGSR